MSDTPETNAAAFDAFDGQGGEVVFADFAKKLERERDELREQLYIAVGMLSTHPKFENKHPEEAWEFVKEAAK